MSRTIANNALPDNKTFLALKLVLLHKMDGSVCPTIAVADLIYRVCAKVILKATFKPGFLLPFQMGAMSPDGVEPIVRAVERAI